MPLGNHQVSTDAHEAARILSGKWIVTVLVHLAGGPKTHSDLARATGLEENKPLDRALHRLVGARLVERTVHNVRGSVPRVRYCLTNQGHSVLPIIDELAGWWQVVDNDGQPAAGRGDPG
ncbi:MAG TPA: helix-turn-helix domain-containing protein [Trebonia sp.]|nr:helix-turn-helix domain-containing protein [Trebonia sp.]